MNGFFEELVERAQYYERFDFVNKDEKQRSPNGRNNHRMLTIRVNLKKWQF